MRVEDLSGEDAAVYRAVAEAEVDAGAPHLQDIARRAGLDLDRVRAAVRGGPRVGRSRFCLDPSPPRGPGREFDAAASGLALVPPVGSPSTCATPGRPVNQVRGASS